MICGVHGFIGAALGKLLNNKRQAFWAGVMSHFIADMLPHRDMSVPVEAALAVTSLTAIGVTQGVGSPAFYGALGAMLPDAENAYTQTTGRGRNFFPTHNGLHGAKIKELAPQVGLVLLSVGILLAVDFCANAPDRPE